MRTPQPHRGAPGQRDASRVRRPREGAEDAAAEENRPRRESAAVQGREARSNRPALECPPGARPEQRAPVILAVEPGEAYALLDSGDGEKLERYGPVVIRRPENQAIWPRRLPSNAWDAAGAVFTGDLDEEGPGRWRFPAEPLGETFPAQLDGLDFLGRFTSFRHVGVFPEQLAHWRFVAGLVAKAKRPLRVLNLFGYTGLATLHAARAREGVEVTHVDASRKAIGWARENAAVARLESRPIRWVCEDAVRYAEREAKRGSRYDVVLLDPPKFGRGPNGEVWQIEEDLPYLLALSRRLLSDRPLALVLTAYAIRSSFFSLSALLAEHCRGLGGTVEAGELVIEEAGAEPRTLSTSLFARWSSAP